MRTLVLVTAMFRRSFIELRRYAFNTITGMITIYLVFLLVFYGAKATMGATPTAGTTLSHIVVGFLVWSLAVFTYSDTAFGLTQEAQVGTLEQLSMSPFGLTRVSLASFVAGIGYQLAMLLLMLVAMMASTGKWLNVDLVSVVPLLVLTIAGVWGVGLFMGGLAVVYKRVQNSIQILQFVFVAMIAAPLDRFPLVKYLPLAWGNQLIGRVMVEGTSIFRLPGPDLALLVAVSGGWLILGLTGFRLFELKARNEGRLAHY